jgi:vacuolar protein sorting-associated protein 13A/C
MPSHSTDSSMHVAAQVSPDVMQLVGRLQSVVLQPLVVPNANQPLVRLDKFEKLWSSYQAGDTGQGPPYPTAGAGGVDVMSGDKGVTVWRPQPPMGYAITGHIITAGGWRGGCRQWGAACAAANEVASC